MSKEVVRIRILLRKCALFDGIEPVVQPNRTIVIDGERIVDVCDDDVLPPKYRGSPEVNMANAHVMSGLANMHTHFSLSLPGPGGDTVSGLSPHELALYMASGARRTLLSGVTTVRCVAEKEGADFALRRAIGEGWAAGPRIFTAGKALCTTGGHGHTGSDTLCCDGADDFRKGVRAQVAAGADVIKVMLSGGIAGENEQIHTPQVTAAELTALIETAHAWERRVTAHAGPADAIRMAVKLGLDCVEHGYQLTREVAELMASRGTALVPTLIVTRCKDFFDSLGVPDWMQQRSLGAANRHEQSYRLALAAGVSVMLGSDMPPFWPVDGTNATVRELEHMAAFGLDAVAALRAATMTPAQWLGSDADVGTVQVGRYADLVAMDDDPTSDVSALRGIRWVMKSGRVVRDDAADALASHMVADRTRLAD